MLSETQWDVIVIGAGPAGLAAAVAAHDKGARVCVIEREDRPGGVLKQCVHDGFGLVRFGERLTGPEYAYRYIRMLRERQIPAFSQTFVLEMEKRADHFKIVVQNRQGVMELTGRAVVSATGCRERTSRQVFIHGERPAGVFTAGTVQHFVNLKGYLPTRRCVILGSGDIGLIMARRLTLEGAEVEGVYEIKAEPSGLMRNVTQCLEDYRIPLHLSTTVTSVHGRSRVEGVSVCRVDSGGRPLADTERFVECDALVLSVGLIPENDMLDALDVVIDPHTAGPVVDQRLMTLVDGLFVCGNALHVNDLADHVSEGGETAGGAAALYAQGVRPERHLVPVTARGSLLYAVPQLIDTNAGGNAIVYFRSSRTMRQAFLSVTAGSREILSRRYPVVRPPEMERLVVPLPARAKKDAAFGIKLEG